MKHRANTTDTEDVPWVEVPADGAPPVYHGPLAAGIGLVVNEYLIDEYPPDDDGGEWTIYVSVGGHTGDVQYTGADREETWRRCIGHRFLMKHGQMQRGTKGFPVTQAIKSILD